MGPNTYSQGIWKTRVIKMDDGYRKNTTPEEQKIRTFMLQITWILETQTVEKARTSTYLKVNISTYSSS